MNKVFNFKRFGNYLLYSLRDAEKKYLLTFLIASLCPVIFYFFYQCFNMLIEKEFGKEFGTLQIVSFITSILILLFSFPSKLFGTVTEKKAGAEWLMLPASGFEKWLSMILMCTVIMPLGCGILLFGSDALLSLIPEYGPSPMFSRISLWFEDQKNLTNTVIVYPWNLLYAEWCEKALLFTLGATIFKKAKTAKTFLCYLAISLVLVLLLVALLSNNSAYRNIGDIIDPHPGILNLFINIKVFLPIAILAGALFVRIKTIKL